jgi:hypothetical protein
VIDDLVKFVGDLVSLMKAGEVEEAAHRVDKALRTQSVLTFKGRQDAVGAVTRTLHLAQRQRDLLLATVASLPERERAFARIQIEDICLALIDSEIASLREKKRQFSRPG